MNRTGPRVGGNGVAGDEGRHLGQEDPGAQQSLFTTPDGTGDFG